MSDRVNYTQCPLCDSSKFSKHYTGDCSRHPLYDRRISSEIVWLKCDDCTHVFTSGYYTEEACKIIFGKTLPHQRVGAKVEQQRYVSAKMIDRILPYKSDGAWLDVGFGDGSLLFTAGEYGFTPIGIDLRSDNVNTMNKLGIKAFCMDIADLVLDEKCSVISMADVLEHIPFPKTALEVSHKLLDDKGVLFLSMPNSENIIWDMMTKENVNPYWGELEHYHNFSRTRLYELLQENGFTPVSYGISSRYKLCMEVIAVKN